MRKTTCGLLASAALLFGAWAQGADLRAYMLASSCLNCHGDGSPAGEGIPSLAGRERAFIAAELTKFRDGERSGTVMPRLAKGYADDEIALLAEWLAARTDAPGGGHE